VKTRIERYAEDIAHATDTYTGDSFAEYTRMIRERLEALVAEYEADAIVRADLASVRADQGEWPQALREVLRREE
jgi:hypothetical protein